MATNDEDGPKFGFGKPELPSEMTDDLLVEILDASRTLQASAPSTIVINSETARQMNASFPTSTLDLINEHLRWKAKTFHLPIDNHFEMPASPNHPIYKGEGLSSAGELSGTRVLRSKLVEIDAKADALERARGYMEVVEELLEIIGDLQEFEEGKLDQ